MICKLNPNQIKPTTKQNKTNHTNINAHQRPLSCSSSSDGLSSDVWLWLHGPNSRIWELLFKCRTECVDLLRIGTQSHNHTCEFFGRNEYVYTFEKKKTAMKENKNLWKRRCGDDKSRFWRVGLVNVHHGLSKKQGGGGLIKKKVTWFNHIFQL